MIAPRLLRAALTAATPTLGSVVDGGLVADFCGKIKDGLHTTQRIV